MDQLIYLKAAVIRTYLELDAEPPAVDGEPDRKGILLPICRMFKEPLIKFEDTYKAFIIEISNNSAIFDRWINIQMQLITDLEDKQEGWSQLKELYDLVLAGTLDNTSASIDASFWGLRSFRTALAFRIFVDSLSKNNGVQK